MTKFLAKNQALNISIDSKHQLAKTYIHLNLEKVIQ